ncbi:MAG TPA: GNAT family N-acetyltransferase [Chitinophagaceae bacterium]|nr:GNAT family N-acetyltransferase [Chitinophagaceae bacterium]
MPVSIATASDIPSLVNLLNRAYRGDASKQGWTTEADMISGEIRTDEEQLKKLLENPEALFLKATNERNELEGCVFLDKREGKLYLGMLSVDPALQAKGTGKQLMEAAEYYATILECNSIFMRVISVRPELIAWYERKGYYRTGETQPFEDSKYGKARGPFEFWVMQKDL